MAFYTNPLDYCRFWPISLRQTHSKCKILLLRYVRYILRCILGTLKPPPIQRHLSNMAHFVMNRGWCQEHIPPSHLDQKAESCCCTLESWMQCYVVFHHHIPRSTENHEEKQKREDKIRREAEEPASLSFSSTQSFVPSLYYFAYLLQEISQPYKSRAEDL